MSLRVRQSVCLYVLRSFHPLLTAFLGGSPGDDPADDAVAVVLHRRSFVFSMWTIFIDSWPYWVALL